MNQPDGITVQAIFEQQVATRRTSPAFISKGGKLTFGELNERVNRLAHRLKSLGVGPGDVVGVCIENSPELVVALLGVLKSGAAFAGIESSYPRLRIYEILDDAGCRALILSGKTEGFDEFDGHKIIVNSQHGSDCTGCENPENLSRPDSLFQVVYTSGSTGKPKGVLITTNAFIQKLKWIDEWRPVEEKDVLLMYRSVGVAAGAWDCFMGPLSGLRTVIAGKDELNDPGRLWKILREHKISHFFASPMLLQAVLDEAVRSDRSNQSLKLVTSSGEPLPEQMVKRWTVMFPEVPLLDVYGCSEYPSAMVCDVSNELQGEGKAMKWKPTRNTTVLILNEDLSETEIGCPGQIHLSGPHLAMGYLNDETLTQNRFIRHPMDNGTRLFRTGDTGCRHDDGAIEILGRTDNIVNIKGFRVSLAEVEQHFSAHPALKECAVIAYGEPTQLIAFYAPRFSVRDPELRSFLRQRLPGYMVPAHFFEIDKLPRTLAGKLDRNELANSWKKLRKKSASDVPTTPLEKDVADIWTHVLGTGNIGVNDEFLHMGGDSISAMRILSRLNQRFNLNLEISDFFHLPNIRDQAQLLESLLTN